MRYYDTSAIVKRYIEEEGSEDLRRLLETDGSPVTGAATGSEMAAALAAAVRGGRLSMHEGRRLLSAFLEDWEARFRVVLLDRTLASRAGELAWDLGLRGYDAVHLATAVRVGESVGDNLVLVTFDRQMHRAARQLGISTYPEDIHAFCSGRAG